MRLRRSSFLSLLVAACVGVLLAPPPSPARPKKGTLTLRMKKLGGGPPAKTLRSVHLVDASTGEVLLGTDFGANGKATLRPPPAVAFAIATIARPTGVRTGVSKVFRFDPSSRKTVRITLRAEPAAANPSRASGARPRYIPGAPIATMGHVTLSDGGHVGSMSNALLTGLFNATSDVMTWVDSSTGFIIAQAQELALQDQGLTDPSTHISDNRLLPDIQIEGELTIDPDGHVTGEITIVDPNTGEVLDRFSVDLDVDSLRDLVEQLARELIKRLRARATTTTTTSTTTTSSSSSSTSSTTQPTTTPTTGAPPTTTATTFPPGTCTSILPASFCKCSGGGHTTCTGNDNICVVQNEGTCVDHVGHTKVTFAFAGQGGRLGAVQIATPDDTDFNDGLYDVNNGQGVGVLGGCGTPAFTQGSVPALEIGKTSCSAYYHPGTTIVVRAGRHLIGAPHQPPWCLSDFDSFSGPTGCAGTGTCDAIACTCSFIAGSGDQQLTINYTAQQNVSCTAPAVP